MCTEVRAWSQKIDFWGNLDQVCRLWRKRKAVKESSYSVFIFAFDMRILDFEDKVNNQHEKTKRAYESYSWLLLLGSKQLKKYYLYIKGRTPVSCQPELAESWSWTFWRDKDKVQKFLKQAFRVFSRQKALLNVSVDSCWSKTALDGELGS